MSTDIFIAIAAVVAVAALLVIKIWGYKALKFKMDESAIISFLGNSIEENNFVETETISAGTNLEISRVTVVCMQSSAIQGDKQESQCWCLKK